MKWISLDDKEPNYNEVVLVLDEVSKFRTLARLINDDEDYFEAMHLEKIEQDFLATHWLPIPKFPG